MKDCTPATTPRQLITLITLGQNLYREDQFKIQPKGLQEAMKKERSHKNYSSTINGKESSYTHFVMSPTFNIRNAIMVYLFNFIRVVKMIDKYTTSVVYAIKNKLGAANL